MGTRGYEHARTIDYRHGEVVLEVGSGESTRVLAAIGPPVVTVDASPRAVEAARAIDNVEAHLGRAEEVLHRWSRSIGFAWLDGYDWPYTGNPPEYYADQRYEYERRGWTLSQYASRRSHLDVVVLVADHARVIAFDDTWRTHEFVPLDSYHTYDVCAQTVPPATTPAPALAMDQALHRSTCGLTADHPHHVDPDRGWEGKGGTAVPYLLDRGFEVAYYGLGTVVVRRGESER